MVRGGEEGREEMTVEIAEERELVRREEEVKGEEKRAEES